MQASIFKVRFLNLLGKEVAEFGYFESELDAESRRAEVARTIYKRTLPSEKGTMDILKIKVELNSKRQPPIAEHYEIKDPRRWWKK